MPEKQTETLADRLERTGIHVVGFRSELGSKVRVTMHARDLDDCLQLALKGCQHAECYADHLATLRKKWSIAGEVSDCDCCGKAIALAHVTMPRADANALFDSIPSSEAMERARECIARAGKVIAEQKILDADLSEFMTCAAGAVVGADGRVTCPVPDELAAEGNLPAVHFDPEGAEPAWIWADQFVEMVERALAEVPTSSAPGRPILQ